MMKIIFVILFLLLQIASFSQSANLRCLDVKNNGDVEISWLAPIDDCGAFSSYEVFASTDGISFTSVQLINNQAILSFLHLNANAHIGARYYYIETITNCGTFRSDTFSTMFLVLGNPGTGIALLNWNRPILPISTGLSNNYEILKEKPTGIWNSIGSSSYSTPTFIDTIYACSQLINYRIVLNDESGCVNRSNIVGDVLSNAIPPAIPILDTVSVDQVNGNAFLEWSQNTEPDIAGYLVYYYFPSGSIFIDTVWGGETTSYYDDFSGLTHDAGLQSVIYTVAAFDSCNNRSQYCPQHNTIYAFPYLDSCNQKILIDWNAYINWESGVARYEVYMKEESGNYQLLANVGGGVTECYHNNIQDKVLYCYYVKAVSATGQTSTSNFTCMFVNLPQKPKFLNADYASITNYNNLELAFSVDNSSSLRQFKLLRSNDIEGPWDTIYRISAGIDFVGYDDYVDMLHQRRFYKLIAENRCMQNIDSSNISGNIVLKLESDGNYLHFLEWKDYLNYKGGTERYNIYRVIDDGSPELIGFVPGGGTEYTDDVSGFINSNVEGHFCYFVEAVETDFNPHGIKGISRSNISCGSVSPFVQIPNAFTPNSDGINDLYKPKITFGDRDGYLFRVYDRWGSVIFETNDISAGWNGYTGNKMAPMGVYVYLISFVSAENKVYEYRGFFTLLK